MKIWNGTGLGDEFMLTFTRKMEKIIDAILKILLQAVVVLNVSYSTVYTFLGLSCILKGLCPRLENKDFP